MFALDSSDPRGTEKRRPVAVRVRTGSIVAFLGFMVLGNLHSLLAQHWFSAPLALDAATRTQVAVDLDGDGDLDLIRVDGLAWSSASVWLNDGTGTFRLGTTGPLPSGVTQLMAAGDFTGDGFADFEYRRRPRHRHLEQDFSSRSATVRGDSSGRCPRRSEVRCSR